MTLSVLRSRSESAALEATLDAAHEGQRLYRHGPYAVSCPTCHVPPGVFCLARRSVHAARRTEYRKAASAKTLVPLLVPRQR